MIGADGICSGPAPCPPPPPYTGACPAGCQDYLYCAYDKCGATKAMADYNGDTGDGLKSFNCENPSQFHSWGTLFAVLGGCVFMVVLGGLGVFFFIKKQRKEGGATSAINVTKGETSEALLPAANG
eukprot:SAG31_NODE_6127_length_2157_cov_1.805151_1_plen_126_part_00